MQNMHNHQALLSDDSQRRWQRWILLLVPLGLMGVLVGVYRALTDPASSTPHELVARLIPPFLFGLIVLAVLTSSYLAGDRSIMRVLEEGLLREKMEAELNRQMTLLDAVTEVYNRRYLRPLLEKEIGRANRHNAGLSAMMVHIMHFRRVNESLGPIAADAVLKEVAHLIQRRIRNSDSIVRYGGDEFLLILSDTDPTMVHRLAERLRHGLEEWTGRNDMAEFQLSFAYGISHYQAQESIDQFLTRAERQMSQNRDPLAASSSEEKRAGASAG